MQMLRDPAKEQFHGPRLLVDSDSAICDPRPFLKRSYSEPLRSPKILIVQLGVEALGAVAAFDRLTMIARPDRIGTQKEGERIV
jgi:hypothetical protein